MRPRLLLVAFFLLRAACAALLPDTSNVIPASSARLQQLKARPRSAAPFPPPTDPIPPFHVALDAHRRRPVILNYSLDLLKSVLLPRRAQNACDAALAAVVVYVTSRLWYRYATWPLDARVAAVPVGPWQSVLFFDYALAAFVLYARLGGWLRPLSCGLGFTFYFAVATCLLSSFDSVTLDAPGMLALAKKSAALAFALLLGHRFLLARIVKLLFKLDE